MTVEYRYVAGALLTWIGWFFIAKFVILASRRIVGDSEVTFPRLITNGVAGGLALILSSTLQMQVGPNVVASPGLRLPLVWFVMPYSAWLAAACAVLALLRGGQAILSINADERMARAKAAGLSAVFVVAFIFLYRHDPTNKIGIVRGGIPFTAANAASIVVLASVATLGMIWAARTTRARGYLIGFTTQAALLSGSVLFGLPFAFLLVTSFKEDQDMSSPNGIVWVPSVQETVPFFDKADPLFQGSYSGQSVRALMLHKLDGGQLQLVIQTPMALRGTTFDVAASDVKEVPKDGPVVSGVLDGKPVAGYVDKELDNGLRRVHITSPSSMAGVEHEFEPAQVRAVRHTGLRWQNYPESLSYLPVESNGGIVFLKNTLIIVILSVVGTILSCGIVSYAFSRMKFPGREFLFGVLLSTMMLPAAVTLMPQFLIFRDFGWIDTLLPLWAPSFFGSAFNIFLLRQFFVQIPMELEDAAKIDGCSYFRTFAQIMVPQIKPALAVVAVTTFVAAWNNFMGPLIYISSPEHMPLSYALQLYQADRHLGEPGLLMAFATLCMLPVLALFFFAQRYFIEGVTLSGLGGR